ncbi:MAG: hypothetical protein KA072_13660 [Thermoanaerobaculaceae bacterium]|nr:hypothetical protein [Thermoanaerobaculaceae bacterium]MDI9621911.1 hypothetical protein [Acidobacteriota bacterium]NLH11619.1 hypothetical protein [Holophagae bacterium]
MTDFGILSIEDTASDDEGVWLSTNELEEAIGDLEMVAELLPGVLTGPRRWRWVIPALHRCLQGFMVSALVDGNGLRCLDKKSFTRWMEAYRTDRARLPSDPKIDSFLNLYKKVKDRDTMRFYVMSKPFRPTGQQERSVKLLNGLRNELTHFQPRVWGLEVSGLPGICRDCLEVAHFLAFESGNILWIEDEPMQRTTRALTRCLDVLVEIERAYGVGAGTRTKPRRKSIPQPVTIAVDAPDLSAVANPEDQR